MPECDCVSETMAWGFRGAYHKLRDGHPPDNAVRTLVAWTAWHFNQQNPAVLNVLGALRDAAAQLRGLPPGAFLAAEQAARSYLNGTLDAIASDADGVLCALIEGARGAFEEVSCDMPNAQGDDEWVMERASDKILPVLADHCLFDVERDNQRAAKLIVQHRAKRGLADTDVQAEVVGKYVDGARFDSQALAGAQGQAPDAASQGHSAGAGEARRGASLSRADEGR